MTMRLIKLPNDLMPLTTLLLESFQYPENETWNIRTDEKEQMIEAMKNFNRLWPLIRLIQMLSPVLQDIFRGFIWEEEGKMVGTVAASRHGSTDTWMIGNVGVLPEFRRRGIARKLVNAMIAKIRERGGRRAILGVISENVPAYSLYEELGFENYSGSIEFHAMPEIEPSNPELPQGYIQLPLKRFDWRPRFELEKRICPESLTKFEPIEVGRFREPFLMRVLSPLASFAQGMREGRFIIRSKQEGQIVAAARYLTPTRGKGVINLDARMDPSHPQLASYITGHLLNKVVTLSPGFRVEISVPNWMEPLVTAVEDAGFEQLYEYRRMGIEV